MARKIQNIKPKQVVDTVADVAPENLAATASNFIEFLINDPTTANLVDRLPLSQVNTSLFNVAGYVGPNTNRTVNAGIAANCCGVLNYDMVNVYNKYADIKISKWAAVKTLLINPVAGNMANAFYDRNSLKFFHFQGQGKAGRVYTALSADVISHELGHAILDFLRPEFWSTASLEIFAFHEAFGDVFAFLSGLHHDAMINEAIKQTSGNLFETSVASKIGEQFGLGLGMNGYLRNVDNDFKYVKLNTLPSSSPNENVLTKQPHNFSRVISGVVYRIFAEIYNSNGKNKNALIAARDFTRNLFFKAARLTPATSDFCIGFGRIMSSTAKILNPAYSVIVDRVLKDRNFLSVPAMAANCIGNDNRMMINEEIHQDFKINIYEHIVSLDDIIETDKHKCLSGVKLKVPCDDIMFDDNRFGMQKSDMLSSIECATEAVTYLIENNLINDTWKVNADNVLERDHIRCDGFINNCTVEGQPEYGKCWKYATSGCGCGGPYGCAPEPKKVEKPVENFCGANYSIRCANTRTSACRG